MLVPVLVKVQSLIDLRVRPTSVLVAGDFIYPVQLVATTELQLQEVGRWVGR